jgi:hypothetical protein
MDMCRLAAGLLFKSEHASVINIASMYGVVGSTTPMAALQRHQRSRRELHPQPGGAMESTRRNE